MATGGWEGVTQADIARRRTPTRPSATSSKHKYKAEPCIVTDDGTVFTVRDIATAEAAGCVPPTGTLVDRARSVGIVGQWFASTKEGKRYVELRALERRREIAQLRLQVAYDLTVVAELDGRHQVIGRWIADFVYCRRDGELVTEDTKGMKTPLYLRSKKHFIAQYGLPILET